MMCVVRLVGPSNHSRRCPFLCPAPRARPHTHRGSERVTNGLTLSFSSLFHIHADRVRIATAASFRRMAGVG